LIHKLSAIEKLLGLHNENQSIDDRLLSFLENSEQLLQEKFRSELSPPLSGFNNIYDDTNQLQVISNCSISTNGNSPFTCLPSECSGGEPMSPPVTNESDFDGVLEEHLLGLSDLFFTGYSVDDQFRHVTLTDRGRPISSQLRKAICFHATFLSMHPQLFPGIENPTFEDRLKVSKKYSLKLENDKTNKNVDNQSLCDEIRSLLIHAVTLNGIGNLEAVYAVIGNSNLYSGSVIEG
jgi:hypothetical protein